jgi:hypothetical protein
MIKEELLHQLDGGTLFYPCCWDDTQEAIKVFAPYIRNFWFVDIHYSEQVSKNAKPVIRANKEYKLLDIQIWHPEPIEEPAERKTKPSITPVVRSETYLHALTGKEIVIHRRKGYGMAALYQHIPESSLQVFFYRGDSQGESGSDSRWLGSTLMKHVLSRLQNRGLIVTDGSNCYRPYRKFAKFSSQRAVTGAEAILQVQSFSVRGDVFDYIGHVSEHCGPTLIWQVTKADEVQVVDT